MARLRKKNGCSNACNSHDDNYPVGDLLTRTYT